MPVQYIDVPSRRIVKGLVRPTRAYRSILGQIGRAMRAGAEVDFSADRLDGIQEGDVVERVTVTIGDVPPRPERAERTPK